MAKRKYDMKFVKWKDPYGENVDEVEWPGWDAKLEGPQQAYKDSYSQEEEDKEEVDVDEGVENNVKPSRPVMYFQTPMGPIPFTEYTQPSKVFNFWVGHSNFNLTEGLVQALEQVDGVEIMTLFTRYRCRIGIGEMFPDREVLREVIKEAIKYTKERDKNIKL